MPQAGPRIHHCPSCGGPANNPHASACEFCQGPLVPMGTPDPRRSVRCSSCASLVSMGASFCSNCGDPLAQAAPTPVNYGCPACPGEAMAAFHLQPTPQRPQGHAVHGCRRCGGVWVERNTLDVMIETAATTGTGDGRAPQVKRRTLSMNAKVVYRACPACQDPMNRRNFARISGVIVDECRDHGTFFDAGELEDVLAFVRSGGLMLSRRRQQDELEREKRRTELANMQVGRRAVEPMSGMYVDSYNESLSLDTSLDLAFLRWAGRWVRNMFR